LNLKQVKKLKEKQFNRKEGLSKMLPHKGWKKILLITFLAVMILGSVFYGYLRVTINRDIVSPLEVINADGSKKALVVYQVGLSSGPRDASYEFADGLVSSGWRVEITTASPEAPSEISDYNLFVIVFPVNGARPGEAATRYVTNLCNLDQIPTIIVNCRLSNAIENNMKEQVTSQNGTVYTTLLAGATDLREYGSQIVI
jgi:hypothetical protein